MKKTVTLNDLKKVQSPTFTDGVLNTDTSLVSATAAFVAGDVGKVVQGAGIFPNSTISTVSSGTTVVLSHATTATGTGKTFIIAQRASTSIDVPIDTLPAKAVIEQLAIFPITKLSAQANVSETDGVINGTTTMTSASAAFVAQDVGKVITFDGTSTPTGAAIQAGTTIVSLNSGSSVVLSHIPTLPNADQTLTDGVTNTDTSLVSATAAFVAADVGKTVSGTAIFAGTTISSVTNTTTVVLSHATTATGSSKTFTIVARAHTAGTGVHFTMGSRELLSAATARFYAGTNAQGSGATDVYGATTAGSDLTPELESTTGTTALVLRVVTTGANLSQLTAGQIQADYDYNVLE